MFDELNCCNAGIFTAFVGGIALYLGKITAFFQPKLQGRTYQEDANTFLGREYRILAIFIVIVVLIVLFTETVLER